VLLREVRLVAIDATTATEPVDVRMTGTRVSEVAPGLAAAPGEEVHDAGGRWLIPGLWDAHVHLGQWARQSTRIDLSGTVSLPEALSRVRMACGTGTDLLVGGGYRPATWAEPPTVAALDAATGDRAVVLVSGDAHSGWFNTAALARFGLALRDEPLREAEWFAQLPAILAIEDAQVGVGAYSQALRAAAASGVVGVVDYEFEPGFARWPQRYLAAGVGLRVRTSTYPVDLDQALAAGLSTATALGDPRLTMGSLKIISDGSVNTRTANCCQAYGDGGHGVQNVGPEELRDLLGRAKAGGLEVALHAIGDAAIELALDAFAATGASGSIEHAQLLSPGQAARMANLGIRASVQPAHLLDDRHVTASVWGEERAARSFAFRELVDSGVPVLLGSDAPVAPLDPWLAIAAAVHRGEPDDEPWYPEHSLTPAEALAGSVDGAGTIAVGSLADLAVLEDDPLAPGEPSELARRLRSMQVAATFVGGQRVH
jgi:predicted amidohydrolase YtcJ